MKTVVVREYAQLFVQLETEPTIEASLDLAGVTPTAFDWLCQLQARFSAQGAQLLQLENRRSLRLDSYVGVVQTPCGTVLEILPKHSEAKDTDGARRLVQKMLMTALNLRHRLAEQASLATFKHSLMEWVMQQFVSELDALVRRGVRFDYQRVEETQRYLCGQLDLNKQLRQPPGQAHVFHIRHDVFMPDRAENRLLMSALLKVAGLTQQADTWRLAQELRGLLGQVPSSRDFAADFSLWKNDRLMAHYQAVLPWCRLVLGQFMPLATKGEAQGISLLFPMEYLFEAYVAQKLSRQIPFGFKLKAQAKSQYLCTHAGESFFQLRPDLLIEQCADNQIYVVLDTKWKLIDGQNVGGKYGLSQSDFYQMLAYGHQYLGGAGDLILIYPKWAKFEAAIQEPFCFSKMLRLWVVPFDLEAECICWPDALKDGKTCFLSGGFS